jgi:hypothetical protein
MIRSVETLTDIGNRIRDFPACSVVPQTNYATACPHEIHGGNIFVSKSTTGSALDKIACHLHDVSTYLAYLTEPQRTTSFHLCEDELN